MRQLVVKAGHWALARGLRVPRPPALRKFEQEGATLSLLEQHRVNVVLDVGANRGFYAQHLRRGGFAGRLLCFEPIASDCRAIEILAGDDREWRVLPYALGREDGERSFNVVSVGSQETVLSSFLPLMDGAGGPTRAELVQIRRLDTVLPDLLADVVEPRIFLKMDTQGFDLEVLAGIGPWLDKVVLLQSELSVVPLYDGMPHYTDALRQIEQLGFGLRDLFVVNRTTDGHVLEYDCLMDRA